MCLSQLHYVLFYITISPLTSVCPSMFPYVHTSFTLQHFITFIISDTLSEIGTEEDEVKIITINSIELIVKATFPFLSPSMVVCSITHLGCTFDVGTF